jgi:hypothetical protein
VPHRWLRSISAATVARVIELSSTHYATFLKAHGQFDHVLARTQALLFPYSTNNATVMGDVAKTLLRLHTPATYPVSHAPRYAPHEPCFGLVHNVTEAAATAAAHNGTHASAVVRTSRTAVMLDEVLAKRRERLMNEAAIAAAAPPAVDPRTMALATSVSSHKFAAMLASANNAPSTTTSCAASGGGGGATGSSSNKSDTRWSRGRMLIMK